MFVSNMKILTLNSQQNVSLSSPPTITQQQVQQGIAGVGSSKDFTHNYGGASTQKSNKRGDQHQKHNNSGSNNKSKYMHANGSQNNKAQSSQQQQQQQKYHNSNSNGKSRKHHYNSNNNSTSSSLNRKRYYQQQQQQNALEQLQQYHQQQQYLTAKHTNQQKTQLTAATLVNHTNTTTNNIDNNNSHLVKNQNYTNNDLYQNTTCKNRTNSPATDTTTTTNTSTIKIPQSKVTSTTIAETCNCSILSKKDCERLSSSTASEYQQLSNNTAYDTQQRSPSSSVLKTYTSNNSTSVPPQTTAAVSPCCKCCLLLPKVPHTTACNFKVNKSNKRISFSAANNLSTNQKDIVDCGSSSAAAIHSANSHLSTATFSASNSKNKSYWKSSNVSCSGGVEGSGDGACSASSKSLDDNVIAADKFGTKTCECTCNNISLSTKNSARTISDICIGSMQKEVLRNSAMSRNSNTLSNGDSNLSTNNFSLTSPASEQKSTNATLKTDTHKTEQHNNEIVDGSNLVSDIPIANRNDLKPNRGPLEITTSTQQSSAPNSYSLDFLHSVGVHMTGGVKIDATSGTENNVRTFTATSPYGSHTTENAAARYSYSYSGITSTALQRPRYMFGRYSGISHLHHLYPQRTQQLTIASSILSSRNSTSNSGGLTSNGGSINYSDQQSNHQQHYTRNQHSRNYNNYYQTHYHQHASHQSSGHPHTYGYGNNGGTVGGEYARITPNVGNQRPAYNGYVNYHNGVSGNNASQYHMSPNQEQARSRMPQSGDVSNSTHRKSSHGSCSSVSSCSSSSSASASSNSSAGTNRKQHQTSSVQSQHKPPLSNQNLAIETIPSKTNSQHGGNQKTGHHHRGHHYSHHNNYQNHHNQHLMGNGPTTPQHQNYNNLTYVSTDGRSSVSTTNSSIGGTSSRGCSPTPQLLPPTPSYTSNNSPKSVEGCPSPGSVSMLANLQLTTTSQQNYPRFVQNQEAPSQQFQQYQQQQFLSKKLLAPLSLSMPSPTPTHIGGTLVSQQAPLGPHNIICCSQLDEASTAAAAAAAKTGIIAGNDYDSDASSTHSSSVSNTAQHRKYQPLKALSISSTSSSSATSLCPVVQLQDYPSQPSTPADATASTTPLCSPLDYTYGASTLQSFPNTQTASTDTHHHQQQLLNHAQLTFKAASNTAAHLPHIYHRNGVVSLLNLPNHSPNNCVNNSEEEYQQQQRQQSQHFYLTPSAQSSSEQLNAVSALSAVTSGQSNSSSGYWSPSHQSNFLYHQLSSCAGPSLIAPTTPSCASSSSSISPSLPDRGEELRLQQRQLPLSGSSSPSTCSSCLNEPLVTAEGCCSTNSSSSNSSICGSFGTPSERGSAQLLAPQQQRLIAQQSPQTHASSSTLAISSGSALTSAQRPRSAGNVRNQQYTPNQSFLSSTSATGNGSSVQQVLPHMFSHQQLQSLPPPPHNLLYSNPQTHHLRALTNSSVHDFFTHTPPDRFLARAHLIEVKEAPATLLTNSKWDNLSQGIWKMFISSQQTEETFKQKMRLWRYLYLFIKNAYPRYGLYLVGSTISGFGSDTSDVDMCLVSRSASNIDPRMEALFNLTVLRDCLSKSGEFEYFNLIEAKVPILRFRDRVHQLEVDLNFNNCVGIKNTHLLHCYSQLDWRLRPLVLVTKLWAQHHNINNAKNMTISSYSLVLMVIHFLQYAVNPPVLPCLHDMFPDKFPLLRSNDFGYVDMTESMGPYDSKNNQPVGELFVNFLEYYSRFDYSQHAISVRTGGILPISVCRTAKSLKNDIHQWKELCIEEPFDLTNTARSVYDYETFERVKAVFVASWHTLMETLDLNSVFLPFIDTSTPPPLQSMSSTTDITSAAQRIVEMSDGFNHTKAGEEIRSASESSSLLCTESRRVIDSSDNIYISTKQLPKYRDSKHILTHCHKEIQKEQKASGLRKTSNPSSPALIGGSTSSSLSTSCS